MNESAKYQYQQEGYCVICENETLFKSEDPWLRDFYYCSNCRSIPRERHLHKIIKDEYPDWQSLIIHESSPSNTFIAEKCANYSFSHYLPDIPNGEFNEIGVQSQNLEELTFQDETFDLFITGDVFEHVFNAPRAFNEIMRVLKPGGAHIFTTPKWKSIDRSFQRAGLNKKGEVIYFEPIEYHGNPISDGKSLVTWTWGRDFEKLLQVWTSSPVTTYVTVSPYLGIEGEFLEVFRQEKTTSKRGSKSAKLVRRIRKTSIMNFLKKPLTVY